MPFRLLVATQQSTVTANTGVHGIGVDCTGPGRRIGLLVDGWLPRKLRHERRFFDVFVHVCFIV